MDDKIEQNQQINSAAVLHYFMYFISRNPMKHHEAAFWQDAVKHVTSNTVDQNNKLEHIGTKFPPNPILPQHCQGSPSNVQCIPTCTNSHKLTKTQNEASEKRQKAKDCDKPNAICWTSTLGQVHVHST